MSPALTRTLFGRLASVLGATKSGMPMVPKVGTTTEITLGPSAIPVQELKADAHAAVARW